MARAVLLNLRAQADRAAQESLVTQVRNADIKHLNSRFQERFVHFFLAKIVFLEKSSKNMPLRYVDVEQFLEWQVFQLNSTFK